MKRNKPPYKKAVDAFANTIEETSKGMEEVEKNLDDSWMGEDEW